MASFRDIDVTQLSGLQYIDALLLPGPDWNYLTDDGVNFRTSLYYTFSTTSGMNGSFADVRDFTAEQENAVRDILGGISELTGVDFVETSDGTAADIHFASADLNSDSAGTTSVSTNYDLDGTQIVSLEADAWVYLNHAVDSYTATPSPGTFTFEELMHQIGHAMGLKHPDAPNGDNSTILEYPYTDDTAHTLMSQTRDATGNYYSNYRGYDLAALSYLYGSDGLGGDWGVSTGGAYLTGSSLDETFALPGGTIALTDQGGVDSVIYADEQSSYTLSAEGSWMVVAQDSLSHYISSSIEYIEFAGVRTSYSTLYAEITEAADDTGDSSGGTGGFVAPPVNVGGPQAADDSAAAGMDTLVSISVLNNDSDTAGALLSVTDMPQPGHGKIIVNADDTITYRPDYAYTGTDAFVYEVSDGNGGTSQATVSLDILAEQDAGSLPLTQTQVSQLYVAIFGRASEQEGNQFWQQSRNRTVAAESMLDSAPAREYFGSALDTELAFVSHIYENTLGKTYAQDPDGVDFWVSALDSGYSRAEIIVSIVDAAMDPKYSGLDAQEMFINKVVVSNYCTEVIETATLDEIDTFIGYIADVTHDLTTLRDAQLLIDAA